MIVESGVRIPSGVFRSRHLRERTRSLPHYMYAAAGHVNVYPCFQFLWLYSRQLRAPTKLAHTHLFAHLLSRSTPDLARSRIRSSNRTGDVPPRTNHRVETDRTGAKQRAFTWTVHVATPTRSGTSTATSRQTTRPTSPRRSPGNRPPVYHRAKHPLELLPPEEEGLYPWRTGAAPRSRCTNSYY